MPTKRPRSLSPENHSETERMKDKNAASKKNAFAARIPLRKPVRGVLPEVELTIVVPFDVRRFAA